MSENGQNSEVTGRKVFFLCPTVAVQNRVIDELVQYEYEVYVTKDTDKLKRVLGKYPDSIVFIDINEQMPENQWDIWITGLLEAPDMKNISIGILTSNDDEQIQRKYLQALKVACGYTVMGHNLDKTIASLVSILQTAGAKGRRKYLRAIIERGEAGATVNLSLNGTFINGVIKDISVVGVSCTLEGNPEISKNALFKDIQIRLQTSLLKVEGIVFGSRVEEAETIYVILFTQKINPEVRTKIRKYIQQSLQAKMSVLLG
jgi:hypothetical protein